MSYDRVRCGRVCYERSRLEYYLVAQCLTGIYNVFPITTHDDKMTIAIV